MQLTLHTDYSLRVLMYLGIRPNQQATIPEIAKSYGISRNHLAKVVHNLANMGYINTSRGKGGGMLLAYNPKDINIGDVVQKTETDFNLVECFDKNNNTCPIFPGCALIKALNDAKSSFIGVLSQYTLADVVANTHQLAPLLKIDISSIEKN